MCLHMHVGKSEVIADKILVNGTTLMSSFHIEKYCTTHVHIAHNYRVSFSKHISSSGLHQLFSSVRNIGMVCMPQCTWHSVFDAEIPCIFQAFLCSSLAICSMSLS